MRLTTKLTAANARVLVALRQLERNLPSFQRDLNLPSFEEVGRRIKKDTTTVNTHCKALRALGLVTFRDGAWRSLETTEKGKRVVEGLESGLPPQAFNIG